MSQKPPEDQDPIVQEILKQLEKHFSVEHDTSLDNNGGLDVGGTEMNFSIPTEEDGCFSDISSFLEDSEDPPMQVIEGGKSIHKSVTMSMDEYDEKKEKLRQQWKIVEEVADSSPEADIASKLTEFLQNTLQGDVQVHVMEHPLEMFEQLRMRTLPPSVHRGLISLQHTASQVLVDTESASAYRISCSSGKFTISVASKEYVLYEGQSVDVQGSYIQVLRISDVESTDSTVVDKGWFVSLAELHSSQDSRL